MPPFYENFDYSKEKLYVTRTLRVSTYTYSLLIFFLCSRKYLIIVCAKTKLKVRCKNYFL